LSLIVPQHVNDSGKDGRQEFEGGSMGRK